MFLRSHDRHSEMPALGQEPKLILHWLARTVLNGFGFSAGLLHCNWESYTWLTSMILFVNFPRFLSFFLPNELKKFLHQATIHNVLTVVAAQSVQLWQSSLVHAIVEGTDKWPLLLFMGEDFLAWFCWSAQSVPEFSLNSAHRWCFETELWHMKEENTKTNNEWILFTSMYCLYMILKIFICSWSQ